MDEGPETNQNFRDLAGDVARGNNVMKDAKYIDLPIGTQFRPSVRGPLLTKTSESLIITDGNVRYQFNPRTLVLVDDSTPQKVS